MEKHGLTSKKKKKFSTKSKQRIFTKPYQDESVEKLKRLIQNAKERGESRFYAIKVDHEFCVNKTSNLSYFDDYKAFIDGSTTSVEIIMYFGHSNNCNRHLFYLKENGLGQVDSVDVEKKISEALKKKEQEYLIKSLQEKVEEQAEYIESLEEKLIELKEKSSIQSILKEGLAMYRVFNAGQSNPSALSGAPENESEVTVESEEEKEEDSEEEMEDYEMLFEELYEKHGADGIRQIEGLLLTLDSSKELAEKVSQLLTEHRKSEEHKKNNVQNSS